MELMKGLSLPNGDYTFFNSLGAEDNMGEENKSVYFFILLIA